MNFENRIRRPGSGRPDSRRNPITGEDMPYDSRSPSRTAGLEQTRPDSRPGSRPQGVPTLNLGQLEDREKNPRGTYQHDYQLDTPGTASTVSWGTPEPTERHDYDRVETPSQLLTPRDPKRSVRPAGVPKVNLSQEKKQHKPKSEYHHDFDDDFDDLDPSTNTLHPGPGNGAGDNSMQQLEEGKKHSKLMETVLIDQLNRAAISDPDQHLYPSTPARHQPGMSRGQIRHLHESKVKTTGTFTEQLLAQRVRFGARVLTRNGHDALRELTGFFFAVDNSLTLYEYRQFGKSAKAMPFISRNTYCHQRGRREGQPYILVDLIPGNNLTFNAEVQQSLPQSIKDLGVATFRITDVDGEAKESILLSRVKPSEKNQAWSKLHAPKSQREYDDLRIVQEIQGYLRSKLKKRGIRTVTGMGKHFRQLDRSGDGTLDRPELKEALRQFHIDIPEEKFDEVWDVLDQNGDGVLDYGEFKRGFIGEMNEYRKMFVRKVYRKLDSGKSGVVTMAELCKFYNAHKHPKVITGECGEEEVIQEFMQSFDHCHRKGEVTYIEFEEYYEGLSISTETDEQFVNILKNTWGV